MLSKARGYLWGKSGAMYVDFLVQFFIAITVVVTVISFFNIFVKHQNVVFVAKRLVRAVEVTGKNDIELQAMFVTLVDELGLDGADFSLENVSYLSDGESIQLRDTFTVVVTYPIEFVIASPGEATFSIPFTLQARLPGMSEVFFRYD